MIMQVCFKNNDGHMGLALTDNHSSRSVIREASPLTKEVNLVTKSSAYSEIEISKSDGEFQSHS